MTHKIQRREVELVRFENSRTASSTFVSSARSSLQPAVIVVAPEIGPAKVSPNAATLLILSIRSWRFGALLCLRSFNPSKEYLAAGMLGIEGDRVRRDDGWDLSPSW